MPEFFDPRGEISETRQNLPHWQQGGVWVFATWRLADSVPIEKLVQWEEQVAVWRHHHPEPWDQETADEYRTRFSDPFDEWLDQGHGTCLLRRPENRRIVADSLHHFDGERYRIGSYVIMPSHVHVLFSILGAYRLSGIVGAWKRHTARLINARESRTGEKLWQPDYYDRLIRSDEHYRRVAAYIEANPRALREGTYTLFRG